MATASPAQSLQQEGFCSICMEFFEDPVVVTSCGHGFCKACSTKYPQVSDEHLPCPECRKESSLRNTPHSVGLGNAAEAAERLHLHLEKSLEIEKMCREHKEALRLFCVTDEILICASCVSKAHQNHTVARAEEAAADYKVKLLEYVENLQKEANRILLVKLHGEEPGQELLNETQAERQKIVFEFQLLQQYLNEKERCQLDKLKMLESEIEKARKAYASAFDNDISSINDLIHEIKEKAGQSVNEFLEDIGSLLNRCKQGNFQFLPVPDSTDMDRRLKQLSEENGSLKSTLRKFREIMLKSEWINGVSFPGDVMDGDVQAMAAEIQALRDEVARLTAENAALRAAAALAAPPPPPVPALQLRRCPVKPPAKFDGNRDHFAAFRAQCGLYMRMRPEDFPNEQVRVGFVINQLTGPAAQWATMRLLADDPLLNDCQAFLSAMGRFFGAELRQEMATREVRRLRQGKQSVVDYTIKFQLLMHDLCWNEEALMAQYREGLRGEILDALARTPPPPTLDDLMRTCLQLDSRLEERKLERKPAGSLFLSAAPPAAAAPQAAFSPPPAGCFPEPEPMQLGATRFYLPKAEMDRRRAAGLCFTCGQKGHLAQACPWSKSAENYQSR